MAGLISGVTGNGVQVGWCCTDVNTLFLKIQQPWCLKSPQSEPQCIQEAISIEHMKDMKALPYFSEQIPLGPVPHAQDLNATETSKMLNTQVAPMSQTLLTSGLIAPLSPFHTQ